MSGTRASTSATCSTPRLRQWRGRGASKSSPRRRSAATCRCSTRRHEVVGSQQRIIEIRPFVVRESRTESGRPIAEGLGLFLESYFRSLPDDRKILLGRYRIVDVARKVVGVGSVGTRCWVILMRGKDIDDPLFLQVKGAEASVLEPYAGASGYANHGQRVVVGQRTIQGAPDTLPRPAKARGTPFLYVRQLRDMKGGVDLGARDSASGDPARTMRRTAAGPSPSPTPSLATLPRSPATSALSTARTMLSPVSLRPMPIRPNAITIRSSMQPRRSAFPWPRRQNELGFNVERPPMSSHPLEPGGGLNFLRNPPDFSLVLGGPLFQLLRRARLSDDAMTMVR